MVSIQEQVTRSFYNEGISFTVYGDDEGTERIIPIDCVPRVISSEDWNFLEAGLKQRVKALNSFLEDVYNDGRIIEDGVIPVDVVMECPNTAPRCVASPHPTEHGWPSAAPIWYAPTTAFVCWKTTYASPPACPTWSPTARPSRPPCAASTAVPGSRKWSITAASCSKPFGSWRPPVAPIPPWPSLLPASSTPPSTSTCSWPGRSGQSWWRVRTWW